MTNLYIHPEYLYQKDDWQKWADLYEARPETVNSRSYLYPHFIESLIGEGYTEDQQDGSSKLRRSRELRTKYVNYPEMLVSIWTSVLFKEKPVADKATEKMLGDDIKNIDGKRTSLNSFIKNQIFRNLVLYGKPILLVTSTSQKPDTKADEKAIGARPFFSCIHPLNFVDWSYNSYESGDYYKLEFARYEFDVVEPRTSSSEPPLQCKYSHSYEYEGGKVIVRRFKQQKLESETGQKKKPEPTKTDASLTSQESWQELAPIVTGFEKIPLSIIEDESWIRDVAEETLRFHNLRSNADNILHNQGYQRIWITGVDGTQSDQVKAASESVINFLKNKDSNILQIEPVDLGAYERAMTESVNSIFKLGLNQITTLASDSKLIQSAESKSLDKENLNDLIFSTMEDMETIVNDGLKNYSQIKGEKNFKGQITFNKELSEEDFQQFITVLGACRDILAPYPDITKQAAIKAVHKLNLGEKGTKIALDAIDAGVSRTDDNLQDNDPINGILNNERSREAA